MDVAPKGHTLTGHQVRDCELAGVSGGGPGYCLASPGGPSFGDNDEEEKEEAEGGGGDASDTESSADTNADSDTASDDELDWGPCCPVRDFFEMQKSGSSPELRAQKQPSGH